jgi:hypothetical protein
MKVSLQQFSDDQWIKHPVSKQVDDNKVQLVLCFSDKESLIKKNIFYKVKKKFPNAEIALCSTAGEIYQNGVQDNSQVAVAFEFGSTKIKTASVSIKDFENSYDAAVHLANQIPKDDLTYILVISDGSLVNGSELVKGFSETAKQVLVTGGLAGDAANFKSTLVGLNEQPTEGKIVAIGFYGKNFIVTHGSQGGWDMFGLEKEITKSNGNILHEISDENALDLYKNYLGDDANNLPGAALLFPLSVTIPGSESPVVRTILSIDEEKKSMTFAGDVPLGSRVRFMKANFDKLTMAAATAANSTIKKNMIKPDFSLLISCVGRKLVLGHRIDEEVEAVTEALGNSVPVSGFYSYGEISPFNEGGSCQLHNQTMTITSFYELP